jgi:hypothetical protein
MPRIRGDWGETSTDPYACTFTEDPTTSAWFPGEEIPRVLPGSRLTSSAISLSIDAEFVDMFSLRLYIFASESARAAAEGEAIDAQANLAARDGHPVQLKFFGTTGILFGR